MLLMPPRCSMPSSATATAVSALFVVVATVTLLLVPAGVEADTLYFQPNNIKLPSLYQTAQLLFTGWSSLSGDPTVSSSDFVYFVSSTAASCSTSAASSPNRFSVTASSDGSSGTVDLVILPSIFTVGSSYAACYVSVSANAGFVAQNSVISSNNLVVVPFTVLSSIYSAYQMTPSAVYAGQGPIAVSISEMNASSSGRPLNQGGVGTLRPFLLACDSSSCDSYGTMAQSCRLNAGVSFASISGYGTVTLTGSYIAPTDPNAIGYLMCIPYCYSSSAGCASSSYVMSWTVVVASPITILTANPSLYAPIPTTPLVRMKSTLWFTGTGLTAADRVKIVTQGSSCSSTSSALLSNVVYSQAVVLSNATSASMPFVSLSAITTAMTGQICYSRGANPTIFAPVFQTASALLTQTSDFVVFPMQPSSLTLSPTTPTVGQTFTVAFVGSGLTASGDAAYLVTSSSTTCTVTSTSDPCDGTSSNAVYNCSLTGGSTPTCTTVADPDTNSALVLCACYKVSNSSNYAMVDTAIALAARNPTYTVSPYPVFAGQSTVMTFSGTNLSAADTIRFVASASACDDTSGIVSNVSQYGRTSSASTTVTVSLVAPGSLCLRVCYLKSGTTTWVIARPTTSITADSSCPATRFFISPFALTHVETPSAVTARSTVTVTLSSSAFAVSSFYMIATLESCVLAACSSSGAACSPSNGSAVDYFSSITSGTNALFAIREVGSLVLCVSLGSTYIPVLASTGAQYTITSAAQNPSSFAVTPASTWRVSMSDLSVTFAGTNLNGSTDMLRVLLNSSLLSTKGACPLEGAVVTSVLTATASSSSSSSSFTLRGADTLVANSVLHFCYYLGTSGSRTAVYVGSVNVGPQNPQNFVASGSLRAGELIVLNFNQSTDKASLFPSLDLITYFQFQASTTSPTCRCDATTCASALSSVNSTLMVTGSTASTTWRNPLGFENFGSNAIYVICYTTANSGSATYTGQLSVAMAHPSFYTLGSSSFRVGLPISISVTTLCASCGSLSAADQMIIIQNTSQCADASGINTTEADAVTSVQLQSSTVTVRSLVPLMVGEYRVCYKKVNDSTFSELTFTSSFTRQTITVGAADPASFAPIPAAPTAGQYLVVNLTSCSSTVCGSCTTLRIRSGIRANCWNTSISNLAASSSCVGSATVYQFPNVFLAAGSYTLCFGDDSAISRVPGTLTILAANPAYYSTASPSIFVNQGSRATFSLTGTGLLTTDTIFLLPAINYTCHDLRNAELDIYLNPVFSGWWAPSTTPYSITVNGAATTATWVASDSSKRFTADIISSSQFCDTVGVSCTVQLCYLRAGTSWAPVAAAASMGSSSKLFIMPANPQTLTLDVTSQLRVTQYTLATVTGTNLASSNSLYLSDGLCENLVTLASTVSTPTVSSDGTTWRGVIRFTARNSGTIRACFVSNAGATVTEILNIPSMATVGATLYYTKLAVWGSANVAGYGSHVLTQYESTYFAATTSTTGSSTIVNVQSMYFVAASDECVYVPFQNNVTKIVSNFTRVANQTSYFFARASMTPSSYALCVNLTSGLLFRVTASTTNTSDTSIVVAAPNPSSFTSFPIVPFTSQQFTLSFTFATVAVAPGVAAETQNATGDNVTVIVGGLRDCGLLDETNTTAVVAIPLLSSSSGSGGGATVTFSLPNASNFTVCYRKYNGTYATVPRYNVADNNLQIAAPYPLYYSLSPSIPQSTVSFNITFFSNGTGPLSTSDRAFVVPVTTALTSGPAASDCVQSSALRATAMFLVTSTISSQWRIAAGHNLSAGLYTVCYIVAGNGAGSVVPFPGYLQIAPRQSPFNVTTDSVLGRTIYSGERVRVILSSNESLNLTLVFNAATSATVTDLIGFSTTSTCASLLSSSAVALIPASFGYATLYSFSVHVRFRSTGTIYTCVKRTNRTSAQQFFNFDAVGGPDSPIPLTILAAPATASSFTPAAPRAGVPQIGLSLTFSTGFSTSSLATVFAAPYSAGSTADVIASDGCYLPTAGEASSSSSSVVLVNTTLQFFLSNMTSRYPFPASGWYTLCYQLTSHNVASLPTPVFINLAEPLSYTAPSLVGPGATFNLTFTASDVIFKQSTPNTAVIVSADSVVDFNAACLSMGSLATTSNTKPTGTVLFNTSVAFAGNTTVASVTAVIEQVGSYFVCFMVFDQSRFTAVPNAGGGFVFNVGGVGPTQWSVTTPTAAPYGAGQLLTLTVSGSLLTATDNVKLVNVTSSTSTTNFFSMCLNTTIADSNIRSGLSSQGVTVTFVSSSQVTVSPRVNAAGVYIVCYRSTSLNSWQYVSTLANLTIAPPSPAYWTSSPSSASSASSALTTGGIFELQTFNISIVASVASASATPLSATDVLKLVNRSVDGLTDCSSGAVASLVSVSFVSMPTASQTLWTACAPLMALTAAGTNLTVCYKASSAADWTEVPLPSGTFGPLLILPNTLFETTTISATPRPVETFVGSITTSSLPISRVMFVPALANSAMCLRNSTSSAIAPLFATLGGVVASTFRYTAAFGLSSGGSLSVLVEFAAAPNAWTTVRTPLTIAACDPCSFSPTVIFNGSTTSITLPASTVGSLSSSDTLRLIPAVSSALTTAYSCNTTSGAFGGVTFSMATVTTSQVSVAIAAPSGSSGSYYVCYKKGNATDFAIIVDATSGTPAVLNIVPPEPSSLSTCPSTNAVTANVGLLIAFSRTAAQTLVQLTAGDGAFLSNGSSCSTTTAQSRVATLSLVNVTNATAVFQTPSFLPPIGGSVSSPLLVCYVSHYDLVPRQVGAQITVGSVNPANFSTNPALLSVGMTKTTMTFVGTSLVATSDAFFVVSDPSTCLEYCGTASGPTSPASIAPSFTVDTSASSAARVVVNFSSSFTAAGTFSVCYRRGGGILSLLPQQLVIGPANPSLYSINFVPRVGTRPTLNFTGSSLSARDSAALVALGDDCTSGSRVATLLNVSASATGEWTTFFAPLDGQVTITSYTVCYFLQSLASWVPVAPVLNVRRGGPASFSLSNTPMVGRAWEVRFPEQNFTTGSIFGTGDEALLTCSGCSCWDAPTNGPLTPVAYGTAYTKVSTPAALSVLRLGVTSSLSSVAVCYRVSDSGFARIPSATGQATLDVAAASPANVSVFPSLAFQGERMSVALLTSATTQRVSSTGDSIALVNTSRGCWDTPTMNAVGVYLQSNASSSSSGSFPVFFPSLGPSVATLPVSFPSDFTVCFREANQPEFLHVPAQWPAPVVVTVRAANPQTWTILPNPRVRVGAINASVSFSSVVNPSSSDAAFATIAASWTDRICDNASSRNVTTTATPNGGSSPLLLSPPADLAAGTAVTFCYARTDGTVAEVPQQLILSPSNPSSFVMNSSAPRMREYVQFTVLGSSLSPDNTTFVILAGTTCAADATTTPRDAVVATRRFGSVSKLNASALTFVAQLYWASAASSTYSSVLCALYDGYWSQVGGSFVVSAAVPSLVVMNPAIPRVGQHVTATPPPSTTSSIVQARVLANAGSQSWCHNATIVTESGLSVNSTTSIISSAVWSTSGLLRLCVALMENSSTAGQEQGLWKDVSNTTSDPLITIYPANPRALWTYPAVPRVGQSVTIFFAHSALPTSSDVVFFPSASTTASCDSLTSSSAVALTSFNDTVSSITVLDASDALRYESYSSAVSFKVCYFSALEQAWGYAAGGTVSVSVLDRSPVSWFLASGKLVTQKSMTLGFIGLPATLNPLSDTVWAVPLGRNCFLAPPNCTGCVLMTVDASRGNTTVTFTTPFSASLDGNFTICYALAASTPSVVPGTLEIAVGDILCAVSPTVQVGLRQNVTLRTVKDVNTAGDALQFSFYGSSSGGLCNESLVSDFVAARAVAIGRTSSSVTYSLEWPVTMTSDRYSICYRHEGDFGRVCSCDQFDARSSDCFLSTIPAEPRYFTTNPYPTYSGQSVTINATFINGTATTATSVYLVPLTSSTLTTCADTPVNASSFFWSRATSATNVGSSTALWSFKHNYLAGSSTSIVCTTLSDGSVRRIPSPQLSHVLVLRPYLSMVSLPTAASGLVRVGETLQLQFSHTSALSDDILSQPSDRVTLVTNPMNCNESAIDGTAAALHNATVMASIVASDSSFSSVPATPYNVTPVTTTTTSLYVTFSDTAFSPWYICYRLAGGTWAIIPSPQELSTAVLTSCVTTDSANNGNNTNPFRAYQYVRQQVSGPNATLYQSLTTTSDSAVWIPSTTPCFETTAAAASTVIQPRNSSLRSSGSYLSVLMVATLPGSFKLCYRFGTSAVSIFSPVCTITVGAATPLVVTTLGCFAEGETLSLSATSPSGSGLSLQVQDQFWIVNGSAECVTNVAGARTPPNGGTYVNFTAPSGTWTATAVVNATYAVLPPVTLPSQSSLSSLRLCYSSANASSSVSIIPWSGVNVLEVMPTVRRQPQSAAPQPPFPQVAQRMPCVFLIDGTNTLPVSASNDRVGAALRSTSALGVPLPEGNCASLLPSLTLVAPFSSNATTLTGLLRPQVAGSYVACYQRQGCSIADIPTPFTVRAANPKNIVVAQVPSPRKGQLINVTFVKSDESDAVAFAPASDRQSMVISQDYEACWNLSAPDGGSATQGGNTSASWSESIVYADAPGAGFAVATVSCYFLAQNPFWSYIPNSRLTILPANPIGFTSPSTPAAFRVSSITFSGSDLGAGDRVKLVPKALNCSAALLPHSNISAIVDGHQFVSGSTLVGGWNVTSAASQNTTVFAFASTVEGIFSVCYRLANDAVWTLVYGDLVIASASPTLSSVVPSSALESEVFTLTFSRRISSSNSVVTLPADMEMTAADQIEIRSGSGANCLLPGDDQNILASAPTKTDLLPNTSYFQVALGNRGAYTVCYAGYASGARVPSWGFPDVFVRPNPTSFVTTITSPLAYDVVGLVFSGFGLQSNAAETDSVKLISSSWAQVDSSCYTAPSAPSVRYLAFSASGNISIATVLSTSASTMWVCYKLFGGLFHIMPTSVTFGSPSPVVSSASAIKNPVYDGERNLWNLTYVTTGWQVGDYVFASTAGCTDIAVMDRTDTFTTTATTLLASALVSVSSAGVYATLRVGGAGGSNLSICYRSPSYLPYGSTHVLIDGSLQVVAGVPSLLTAPLQMRAQRLVRLTFNWDVSVALDVWNFITVVSTSDSCQGTTNATVAANTAMLHASTRVVTNTTSSSAVVTVRGVFGSAGTFYVCAASRTGLCLGNVASRDCTRLIGSVVVSEALPQAWMSALGTSLLATESITLRFYPLTSTPSSSDDVVVVPFRSSSSDDAVSVCIASSNGTQAVSSSGGLSAVWDSTSGSFQLRAMIIGTAAVCVYTASNNDILLFPLQTLTISSSYVDAVAVSDTTVSVTDSVTLVASGRGLSQDDRLTLVVAALSGATLITPAIMTAACLSLSNQSSSGTSRIDGVVAAATGYGKTTSTFTASMSALGLSAIFVTCYLPALPVAASQKNWTVASTTAIVTVSPYVESVQLTGLYVYASAHNVITLLGLALQATDRVALVPHATGCASATLSVSSLFSATAANGTTLTADLVPSTALIGVPCQLCLVATVGTVIPLPTVLTVLATKVASLQLLSAPTCVEDVVCSSQPSFQLLDNTGAAVYDTGTTIVLRLYNTSGGSRDDALGGALLYSISTAGVVQFYQVTIGASGWFTLTATAKTLNGNAVSLTTAPFYVTPNASLVSAVLSCNPTTVTRSLGVATSGSVVSIPPNVSTTCTLRTLMRLAPSTFQLTTSLSGSVMVLASSAFDTATGLRTFQYQVTLSLSNVSATFALIGAADSDPLFPGRSVSGSPALITILTVPDATSVLLCSGNLSFNGENYIRSGQAAVCTLQCLVTVGGLTYPVVAPLSSISAAYTVVPSTSTAAATTYPIDVTGATQSLSGVIAFSTGAASGALLRVTALVNASNATGSPAVLNVVQPPTTLSQLTCTSVTLGAAAYYLPNDDFSCVVLFRSTSSTNLSSVFVADVRTTITTNGSVGQLPASPAMVASSVFRGTAPSATGNNIFSPSSAHRAAIAAASSQDQNFVVSVLYTPSGAVPVASATGTLVFVSAVAGSSSLIAGQAAVLTLSGSGLSTSHAYSASTQSNCNGSYISTTVSAGTVTAGDVVLGFTVPSTALPLYICFKPSGAPSWQLLVRGAFTPSTSSPAASSSSSLSDDDIILIVVACVLFGILLLLLPFVCWRLSSRHSVVHQQQSTIVTLPPLAPPRGVAPSPQFHAVVAPPTGYHLTATRNDRYVMKPLDGGVAFPRGEVGGVPYRQPVFDTPSDSQTGSLPPPTPRAEDISDAAQAAKEERRRQKKEKRAKERNDKTARMMASLDAEGAQTPRAAAAGATTADPHPFPYSGPGGAHVMISPLSSPSAALYQQPLPSPQPQPQTTTTVGSAVISSPQAASSAAAMGAYSDGSGAPFVVAGHTSRPFAVYNAS